MAEPGKTVIQIEITHGTDSHIKTNLDAKDRKHISDAMILEYLGEYDWFGDYPAYKVTIDGETREYNRENDYGSSYRSDPFINDSRTGYELAREEGIIPDNPNED